MKRIKVKEAAQKLNMTPLTVQLLMQREQLPIGYAIKKPGSTRYHYIIYSELLDGYVSRVEAGTMVKQAN
jgi:hypothetical protein